MSWPRNLIVSEGRSKADRALDQSRRAQDTIALAELDPSHSILEIEPGKGWFTGLLLEMLNDTGALIVQQPDSLDAFFGKDARNRVVRAGKPNARYAAAGWETLDAADASVDRVVWLQGPHELWFEPQPGVTFGRPSKVFAEVARVLKPEGRFVLIDNMATNGIDQASAGQLHRSVPSVLRDLTTKAGLRLLKEDLDWISSESDPLNLPTYDPKVHLRTHQFVQIYTR